MPGFNQVAATVEEELGPHAVSSEPPGPADLLEQERPSVFRGHVVELPVDVADDVDRSVDVHDVSFFGEDLAELPANFLEGVFGEGFSLCEGVDDGREVHL